MRWRGALSLVLLWLTFAALHDITLDNAPAFPLEYTMLVVSGAWFVTLALYLLVQRHAVAGLVSLSVIALGIVGCWDLPHHGASPSVLNYMVWAPILWFVGIALRMLPVRWRPGTPLAQRGRRRAAEYGSPSPRGAQGPPRPVVRRAHHA